MNRFNRFNRLAKLNRLIKEGAKKKDEITALRNILMNKYGRSAAGLAEPYWNKYIQSRDIDLPVLTEADLPVALPPTKEELIDLLKGSENTDVINKLKSTYPDIDFNQFSSEYLKWLYSRYISREKEEVHPIEDSIPTLSRFKEFQDRYKNDASFREEVAQARLGDISSIEDLTIDHMEKVISLRSGLTVRVHGVDIKEKEFLGKFGDWNLWLPHTKETSTKIAGYDEDTYEPVTDWCTARTKGSNLFYNYIGRDDTPSFLFYIIKDNPENDDDWLSLGYVSQGSRLSPDFSGKFGGLSVNRENEGLREKDYKRILGDEWGSIRSRIEREIESFKKEDGTYESPARSIILELAKDISKFKKEWYPKSVGEKKDFAEVILDSEPSKEVRGEVYKFLAEKDPKEFIHSYHTVAKSYGFDYLKTALEAIGKESHFIFLENYMDMAKAEGLDGAIRSALERLAEKDPEHFLRKYIKAAKEVGLGELVKSTLENLASRNPIIFLDYYLEPAKESGLDELIKSTLENLAKNDPFAFIEKYLEPAKEAGLGELVKVTLESYSKRSPGLFIKKFMEKAKAEGMDDLIKSVLKNLANENPLFFIRECVEEAKEAGLGDLADTVFKNLAYQRPYNFLEECVEKANEAGLGQLVSLALENLAYRSPNMFLEKYVEKAKEAGRGDLTKFALESLADRRPDIFLNKYMEKAKAEGLDHLIKTTIEKLSDTNLRKKYEDDARRIGLRIGTETTPEYTLFYATTDATEWESLAVSEIVERIKSRPSMEHFIWNGTESIWATDHPQIRAALPPELLNGPAVSTGYQVPNEEVSSSPLPSAENGDVTTQPPSAENSDVTTPLPSAENGDVTTASIENKLLKLSRALKSLGLISQASRIRRLTL